MFIDWKIVISASIPIVGLFIGYWLTSKNETKKKKIEMQAEYLVANYKRLNQLRTHQSTLEPEEIFDLVTQVIYEIQLFGSSKQIYFAQKMGTEIAEKKPLTDLNKLVDDLRDSLREYLELDKINEPTHYFNIPNIKKQVK